MVPNQQERTPFTTGKFHHILLNSPLQKLLPFKCQHICKLHQVPCSVSDFVVLIKYLRLHKDKFTRAGLETETSRFTLLAYYLIIIFGSFLSVSIASAMQENITFRTPTFSVLSGIGKVAVQICLPEGSESHLGEVKQPLKTSCKVANCVKLGTGPLASKADSWRLHYTAHYLTTDSNVACPSSSTMTKMSLLLPTVCSTALF